MWRTVQKLQELYRGTFLWWEGPWNIFRKNYWAMKYLGLWSPGLRRFFWKICKTLRPLSYILNVRSLSLAYTMHLIRKEQLNDPNNTVIRSSRAEVFCKKGVLRSFTKFTGKHLCQSFFLITLQASGWWLLLNDNMPKPKQKNWRMLG